MFAAVVIVSVTVEGDVGTPLRVTLVGLKLQSAPVGKPNVQLPKLDAVELVKVTVPVAPVAGVIVNMDVAI
jgi:hypothetical protein